MVTLHKIHNLSEDLCVAQLIFPEGREQTSWKISKPHDWRIRGEKKKYCWFFVLKCCGCMKTYI